MCQQYCQLPRVEFADGYCSDAVVDRGNFVGAYMDLLPLKIIAAVAEIARDHVDVSKKS